MFHVPLLKLKYKLKKKLILQFRVKIGLKI